MHPGGTFGPVDDGQKPSISEERGVSGKEKRHNSGMGVKPGCDCTGNGGMPHCCM